MLDPDDPFHRLYKALGNLTTDDTFMPMFSETDLQSFAATDDSDEFITSDDFDYTGDEPLFSDTELEPDNTPDPFHMLSGTMFDINSGGWEDAPPASSTTTTSSASWTAGDDYAKIQAQNTQILSDISRQKDVVENIAYRGSALLMEEAARPSGMEELRKKLFANDRRIKTPPEDLAEVKRKLDYLKRRIAHEKAQYSGWENKSRRWALIFQVLSSALAAFVTVLLGLKISDVLIEQWINAVALCITAFISIIGVIQRFFDADEKYAKYMDTSYKMGLLLTTIEYLELGEEYISLEDVNLIMVEMEKILQSTYDFEMKLVGDVRPQGATLTASK